MKKQFTFYLSILAILFTISNQVIASERSVKELSDALSSAMKKYDYEQSMELGEELIGKLIDQKDLNNALKIANMFADATSPVVAKFGYFEVSKVYHEAYKLTGKKELLISAGAALQNASNSKEADVLTALYAKDYSKENPKEYIEKVIAKSKQMKTDKSLSAAYNHINYNRFSIVEDYLKSKVISIQDKLSNDGTTLLHMAVWYEKPGVVKKLIKVHGADVNARDKEGDTPLKYAKHKKNESLIALLKQNGATM